MATSKELVQVRITGLWTVTSKAGLTHFQGKLDDYREIWVMQNNSKRPDKKDPDYRVYIEPVEKGDNHQPFMFSMGPLWKDKQDENVLRGSFSKQCGLAVRPNDEKRDDRSPDAILYMERFEG